MGEGGHAIGTREKGVVMRLLPSLDVPVVTRGHLRRRRRATRGRGARGRGARAGIARGVSSVASARLPVGTGDEVPAPRFDGETSTCPSDGRSLSSRVSAAGISVRRFYGGCGVTAPGGELSDDGDLAFPQRTSEASHEPCAMRHEAWTRGGGGSRADGERGARVEGDDEGTLRD